MHLVAKSKFTNSLWRGLLTQITMKLCQGRSLSWFGDRYYLGQVNFQWYMHTTLKLHRPSKLPMVHSFSRPRTTYTQGRLLSSYHSISNWIQIITTMISIHNYKQLLKFGDIGTTYVSSCCT